MSMLARCHGPQVDAARMLLERAVAEADNAEDGLPSVLNSSIAKCTANETAVEVRRAPSGTSPGTCARTHTPHPDTGRRVPSRRAPVSVGPQVVMAGMQLMGAYGYSTAFPMERRMRDVLGWTVAGGTARTAWAVAKRLHALLGRSDPLRRIRPAIVVSSFRSGTGTVSMQKMNIASALVGRRFNQRSSGSSDA